MEVFINRPAPLRINQSYLQARRMEGIPENRHMIPRNVALDERCIGLLHAIPLPLGAFPMHLTQATAAHQTNIMPGLASEWIKECAKGTPYRHREGSHTVGL
jgi:hypothetical protein